MHAWFLGAVGSYWTQWYPTGCLGRWHADLGAQLLSAGHPIWLFSIGFLSLWSALFPFSFKSFSAKIMLIRVKFLSCWRFMDLLNEFLPIFLNVWLPWQIHLLQAIAVAFLWEFLLYLGVSELQAWFCHAARSSDSMLVLCRLWPTMCTNYFLWAA